MTEDTDNIMFPELTDAELDAIVNELPTPTPEAIAIYNAKIEFMHAINKECGVFQDVEGGTDESDELKLANNGKYVDSFRVAQ